MKQIIITTTLSFALLACGKVVKQRGTISPDSDFLTQGGDNATGNKPSDPTGPTGPTGPTNPSANAKLVASNFTISVVRNSKTPTPADLAAHTEAVETKELTFSIVTPPTLGDATIDKKTGMVSYLPHRNEVGVDTLTYEVTDGTLTSNLGTVTINITTIISKVKPAIAVRGMACIVCHADIKSNVVTDFGYGDHFYLGGIKGDFVARGHWYNNNQNSWQSMLSMKGQLYIPDAPIAPGLTLLNGKMTTNDPLTNDAGKTDDQLVAILKGLQAGITPAPAAPRAPLKTLADLLHFTYNSADQGPFHNTYLYWDSFGKAIEPPKSNRSVVSAIEAPAGKPAIVVNKKITIKAPTAAEILAAAPGVNPNTVSVTPIALPNEPQPATPGLVVIKNSVGSFVTNPAKKAMACYGDVVINGTLFLKQAQIDTDQDGCRLYVTGSVFIEGQLTYANPNNGSHLQISSSRGIFMGVGSSPNPNYQVVDISPLEHRIKGYQAPIRSGNVPDVLAPSVLKDMAIVTATNGPLLDAQDPGSSVYDPQAFKDPSNKKNRATVSYNRLLLNAPVVHSRYFGLFSGTIIAEIALFAVGYFKFAYDPVFDHPDVPFLPLLDDTLFFVE